MSCVDEVLLVNNEDAFKMMQILAKEEGIFGGISSGGCLSLAINYLKDKKDFKGVIVLPDTGERYLSVIEWWINMFTL